MPCSGLMASFEPTITGSDFFVSSWLDED